MISGFYRHGVRLRWKFPFLILILALMGGATAWAADVPSVFNQTPKRLPSSNFSIIEPAAGSTVDAGQNVTVTLKPANGFNPVSIFIAGPDIAVEITPPKMSGDITIPKDAQGVFKILVMAKDAAGKISSNELVLQVTRSGPWR
ncbi:MAG: hypothetical protein HY053_09635 [Proteobacteria bacterium]|nr:hypothetical protein [Pseudomonadota bacterium]